MTYEDLGAKAFLSVLVVVSPSLAGTLRRAAVNIHCKIASGITTNTLNSNEISYCAKNARLIFLAFLFNIQSLHLFC